MLSQEQALAERAKTWQFLELWVDPTLFPPRVLMLIGDRDGSCRIFKLDANYQLVVTHSDYEAAKDWLLEDEYERIESQLLAEEILKLGGRSRSPLSPIRDRPPQTAHPQSDRDSEQPTPSHLVKLPLIAYIFFDHFC